MFYPPSLKELAHSLPYPSKGSEQSEMGNGGNESPFSGTQARNKHAGGENHVRRSNFPWPLPYLSKCFRLYLSSEPGEAGLAVRGIHGGCAVPGEGLFRGLPSVPDRSDIPGNGPGAGNRALQELREPGNLQLSQTRRGSLALRRIPLRK